MSSKVHKILCPVSLATAGITRKKEKHLGEGSDIRREATLGLCGFLRMPVDSMFLLKCLSGCEPCIVFLIASTIVGLAGGSSSSPVGGCVHCRGEG